MVHQTKRLGICKLQVLTQTLEAMRALWLPSLLCVCGRATCQMPPSLLLLPQHTPAHPPVTEALEGVVGGKRGGMAPVQCV